MGEPHGLFDGLDGAARRDEAIVRVDEHADLDWKGTAAAIVRVVARQKEFFTTDDVWRLLEATNQETHENRAMGAIMRSASREGICEPTDRTRCTERSNNHKRPIRVWKSLFLRAF